MALKSIYDIEVDPSGKFAAFARLFEKHQKELAKIPASWSKVGEGIRDSTEDLAAMTAARRLLADMEKRAANEGKKSQQAADYTAKSWASISRSTKDVAGNITRATTQLLKWTALTSVFTGLLGAGGLFGIDRLAAGVGAGRRSSQGLGLSYGQERAFGLNFGRLVDTGSFLGNVNTSLHDVSKRYALYGAGLGEGDLTGNTGDVAAKLLPALKRIADQTPDAQLAQVLKARGLDQFVGLQDFQRLKTTSPKELSEIVKSYQRDVDPLSLANRTQKAWQDLSIQMTRAGEKIENVFVRGLTPLAPELEHLSDSFTKAVESLLASPKLKEWIVTLGQGLEKAATYIGGDKFQSDIHAFTKGVGELADFIVKALRRLGIISSTPEQTAADAAASDNPAVRTSSAEGYDNWKTNNSTIAKKWFFGTRPRNLPGNDEREAFIRAEAARLGINPEVALRVARSEGFYNYKGDKDTSFGDFQLHYKNNIPGLSNAGLGDEFTKRTGLDARDPTTWKQQDAFALQYAREHGWGSWHGWRGPAFAGIDRNAVAGYVRPPAPPPQSMLRTGASEDGLARKFSDVLDDMARRNNATTGSQSVKVSITAAPGGNPIVNTQQAASQQ